MSGPWPLKYFLLHIWVFAYILFLLLFPSHTKSNWNLALSQSHSVHQSISPHTPDHHSRRGVVGVLLLLMVRFVTGCCLSLLSEILRLWSLCHQNTVLLFLLMRWLNFSPFFKDFSLWFNVILPYALVIQFWIILTFMKTIFPITWPFTY